MVSGRGIAQPPSTGISPGLGSLAGKHPALDSMETHSQWPAVNYPGPAFTTSGSLPMPGLSPTRCPIQTPNLVHQPHWNQRPSASNFEPQEAEDMTFGRSVTTPAAFPKRHPPRTTHDEFDGPHQFLDPRPSAAMEISQEHDLPRVQANLLIQEQDEVLCKINDRLSLCAFDFVAKYQFPIPLEPDKRPVQYPSDREWNEWVFLLKRMSSNPYVHVLRIIDWTPKGWQPKGGSPQESSITARSSS